MQTAAVGSMNKSCSDSMHTKQNLQYTGLKFRCEVWSPRNFSKLCKFKNSAVVCTVSFILRNIDMSNYIWYMTNNSRNCIVKIQSFTQVLAHVYTF